MLDKLEAIKENFKELTDKLSNPAVIANQNEFQKLAKKRSELEPIVETFEVYKEKLSNLEEAESLLESEKDPEMLQMAELEKEELEPQINELEEKLKMLLIPKDADDSKNTIIEIDKLTAKLNKKLSKIESEMKSLEGRLNNSNFINKAPQEVIDNARNALNESKIQAEILEIRLQLLK